MTDQRVNAVIIYEKDTGKLDVSLFDNEEDARNCYFAYAAASNEVRLRYNLPVNSAFEKITISDLNVGDEVTVFSKHTNEHTTGIVLDANRVSKRFDVLVRKDFRKEGDPSIAVFYMTDGVTVTKTGNNLYSISKYAR